MTGHHRNVDFQQTASAIEARKSFFCELCQKGYSRQNEFAAHESSYDHTHKKRLKELKAMDKTMNDSATKARRNEEKAAGIIKINPIALGGKKEGGGGFKKGGFKSAFAKVEDVKETEKEPVVAKVAGDDAGGVEAKTASRISESDDDDEGYEYYDPRRPTGCPPDCEGGRA